MSVLTVIEGWIAACVAEAKKLELAVVAEAPAAAGDVIAVINGFEKAAPIIDAAIDAIAPAAAAEVTAVSTAAITIANKIKADLLVAQSSIAALQAALATPAVAPAPGTTLNDAPMS